MKKELTKEQREKKRLACKEWYRKNRAYKIRYTLDKLKETGYAAEKTEKQRKIRYIKRRTRHLFPLEGSLCEVCLIEKATEHHHTTNPIEIDKFKRVCHDCHMNFHEKKDGSKDNTKL